MTTPFKQMMPSKELSHLDLKPLELALTGSPVFLFVQDRDLRYTWLCNPMPGMNALDLIGKHDGEVFEASDDVEKISAMKRQVIRSGQLARGDVTARLNGDERHYELVLAPVEDGSGEITGVSGAAIDITQRKHAEQARSVLIRELNHRVKNVLAIVLGIARLTFRADISPREAYQVFEGRLMALSAAHDALLSHQQDCAPLSSVLDLATRICDNAQERILRSGPTVLLNPEQSVAIGMLMHELCTNAMKYGALSGYSGRVHIDWALQLQDSTITLSWKERNGPAVVKPSHEGFGSQLLRSLARQLRGQSSLSFNAEGFEYQLSFPNTF